MRIWKVGWAAFLLTILGENVVWAGERAMPDFLERPLSLCARELDGRVMEIDPAEIFNLHLQSELYAEEQKLPGWMRKSCQEGLEEWVEKQEWYQNVLERLEHLVPRPVLHPYAVAEQKDGEFTLKFAPSPKQLAERPNWRFKAGLDIDTDFSELRDGNYGTFITPALKITALYKDVFEIRAKANPLAEIYRVKISSDRYYFDLIRPELSYKNEKRDGKRDENEREKSRERKREERKKHVLEAGVDFKTWIPDVHAGISGEMNLENTSDWNIGGRIYGYVDWECIIIPSWCMRN